MAVYVESLQPFHPSELEAGVKLALESHRYAKWPKPAELREYCLEARIEEQRQSRYSKSATEQRSLLNKPGLPEISDEERELVAMKARVLEEWQASGRYTAKGPDGSWRYSAADLTAEAKARQTGFLKRA